MKKLLSIVVLGLLFGGSAYAEIIEFKNCWIKKINILDDEFKEEIVIYDNFNDYKLNGSSEFNKFSINTDLNSLVKTTKYKEEDKIYKGDLKQESFQIESWDSEFLKASSYNKGAQLEIILEQTVILNMLSGEINLKQRFSIGNKETFLKSKDYNIICDDLPINTDTTRNIASGSGFFINENGYFITNNHVIEDCRSKSIITFKDKDIEVDLIAKDPNLDLAILKANVTPNNFLKFSSDRPEKLQKIIVAGYPFGKGLSDDLKFTQGIISSLKGFEDNSNELQIDAAINPGNSGGPIVDEKSNLVAVAVSGLSKEVAEGINFGIKSSSVMNFLDVNSIKYSYSKTLDKNVGNKKLSKILEEATVYTYCN